MKVKMILIVAAIALVTFGLYGTSFAFHDGGVARCESCHTMHNSLNGAVMNGTSTTKWLGTQYQAGPWLLQGDTATTACLNCHESASSSTSTSYHVSTRGVDTTLATLPGSYNKAGGDFSWIKTTATSKGMTRGHNVVSSFFGYTADTVRTTAPGGTYTSANLVCSSCHDPHGKFRRTEGATTEAFLTAGSPIAGSGSYGGVPSTGESLGAYRILGGSGYVSKSDNYSFSYKPPSAAAVSYGFDDKVAYGKNMSEWCANCHSGIYEAGFVSGEAGHRHPAANAEKLTAAVVANYNAYAGTGLTGDAKYNRLVPFEEGNSDWAALGTNAAVASGTAASTSANVQCLSCHRAHASGFTSMTRFDTSSSEYITEEGGAWETGTFSTVKTSDYLSRAYNSNTFGSFQRQLCNKCHTKD